MKSIKLLSLAIAFLGIVSCSSDDDNSPELIQVESSSYENLKATQSADYSTNPPTITGDYIKFSFEAGATVSGDNWDIAFRGTTILVNGGEAAFEDEPDRTATAGAYIATGTLADVKTVDTSKLAQDSAEGLAIPTGSGNGWYNYDSTTHVVSPIAGKVIVVRTHDGRYAKVEILSYYENGEPNEDLSNSQYYSFNYVYQPNVGETSF
ncbi:HmuY family protein [Galbibacter sp. EGI 63066]|uniref:HmuY family protein n=1 Tax=Galbibacter sp. EGI 63066 TaxID=2993559 RepID=UPI0022491995|nr:HmuY family protein [Galbibacter sp. EGI 63066]MCX2681862.1 HmuY family protein [Galbibacter sp. EGI 63066]